MRSAAAGYRPSRVCDGRRRLSTPNRPPAILAAERRPPHSRKVVGGSFVGPYLWFDADCGCRQPARVQQVQDEADPLFIGHGAAEHGDGRDRVAVNPDRLDAATGPISPATTIS